MDQEPLCKNIVLCWNCKEHTTIVGDTVEDVMDLPDACPKCRAEWNAASTVAVQE